MYKKMKKRMYEIINEFVELFPEDGDVTIFNHILIVLNHCAYLEKNKPLKKLIQLTRTEKEIIRDGYF